MERGYGSTTVDAVAARADVSPETIYAVFGSKRSLLAELVDVSISGDVDAPPVIEQDWVVQMRGERDPRRRLRLLARYGRAILERRAAIDQVVRGAAASDPDLAALGDGTRAQRFAGQRELLRIVIGDAALRAGMDLDVAADILYAIGSPETYLLLVGDRRWSAARFESWYGDTLEDLIFGPA